MLDGVQGGLGAAGETEFAEDVADVRARGAVRDPKVGRDLLVAQPVAEERQHLKFAFGERVDRLWRRSSPKPLRKELRDHRIEPHLAVMGGADGLDDRPLIGVLEEVPRRAGLEGRNDLVLLDEAREGNNLGRGVAGLDLVDRGDAVLHRHDEVHKDDVRRARFHQANRLLAVRRVADDVHVVDDLEQATKPAPNDGVIIDDEDADPLGLTHGAYECLVEVAGPGRAVRQDSLGPATSVAGDRHKRRSFVRHGLAMTGEPLGGILMVGKSKTTRRSAMTFYIARFGGLALVLIAAGVGVLIGRVIEGIAMGAVLFAVWNYVARLVATPDHEPTYSDGHAE